MILCLLLRKRTQKKISTVKECDINPIMAMKMFYAKKEQKSNMIKKNIERQIIETFQLGYLNTFTQ